MTQQTLLEEVRRHIPNVTQEQLDDEMLAAHLTAEKVVASTALLGSLVGRLRKSVPGGMTIANSSNPVAVPTPKPKPKTEEKPIDEPVSVPVSESIDRDWSTFKIKDLASLTDEELDAFKAYREADLRRKNKMNEILGLEAESLDIESAALQTQAKIQSTSRSVEGDRVAFNLAEASSDELLKLVRDSAEATTKDHLERDREALKGIWTLGKETPTIGELRQLQARQLRRDRMNQAVGIQNGTAPEVQRMQLAGSEPEIVTIDA